MVVWQNTERLFHAFRVHNGGDVSSISRCGRAHRLHVGEFATKAPLGESCKRCKSLVDADEAVKVMRGG